MPKMRLKGLVITGLVIIIISSITALIWRAGFDWIFGLVLFFLWIVVPHFVGFGVESDWTYKADHNILIHFNEKDYYLTKK